MPLTQNPLKGGVFREPGGRLRDPHRGRAGRASRQRHAPLRPRHDQQRQARDPLTSGSRAGQRSAVYRRANRGGGGKCPREFPPTQRSSPRTPPQSALIGAPSESARRGDAVARRGPGFRAKRSPRGEARRGTPRRVARQAGSTRGLTRPATPRPRVEGPLDGNRAEGGASRAARLHAAATAGFPHGRSPLLGPRCFVRGSSRRPAR